MARRRYYSSQLNYTIKELARQQRQAEAEQKRQQRERVKAERERIRAAALRDKEHKAQYLAGRIQETEDLNQELQALLDELSHVLQHTLTLDDTIDFNSLRILTSFRPLVLPEELTTGVQVPTLESFIGHLRPPGWAEKLMGGQKRYEQKLEDGKRLYQLALENAEATVRQRREQLEKLQRDHQQEKALYNQMMEAENRRVDEFEEAYRAGDQGAIVMYNTMVLERSQYPEDIPRDFKVAFNPDSRELVVELELPAVTIIPDVQEYKYTKSKDSIDSKPRKAADIKARYQDLIAAITLRTIHEVFEADQGEHLQVVTFNGMCETVDPATGLLVRPCLISVRTTRDRFMALNLALVDKQACLKNLGASVSSRPDELQAVKPIVEFDRVDSRFVDQTDLLSNLSDRTNLMDLNPTEFEQLVSNLFTRMGLDARLTQSSKDGGVDCIAFDTRPVIGGKIVIQAKRYKNTVDVSAVRDLYGTMSHEGASKGILVTTSGYGKASFEFVKDKPIELIDGGNLLYLLEQNGIRARIAFPES